MIPIDSQEKVPSNIILGRVAGEDPPASVYCVEAAASVVSWAMKLKGQHCNINQELYGDNMVILFWLGYSLDIPIYNIYIYMNLI